MTAAIVTITCPKCGGRLEGIESLDQPRTIACTFCQTDLHVPRVGEQVVREVVRETHVVRETQLVHAPPAAVVPDGYQLQKKPNPKVVLVGLGIALGAMLVVLALSRRDASDTISAMERRDAERQACKDRCKASCKDAGQARAPAPAEGYGDPEVDRVMRESGQALRQGDVLLCELDCEKREGCNSLGAAPP